MEETTNNDVVQGEVVTIGAVTLQSTAKELGERVEEARKIIYIDMKSKDRTKNWVKLYLYLLLPWMFSMILSFLSLKLIFNEKLDDSSSSSEDPHVDSLSQQVPPIISESDMVWGASRTNPISKLSYPGFQIYVGSFFWLTLVITGLGFEFLIFNLFLMHEEWSERIEAYWKVAQFFFSLILATAFGMAFHMDYAAMPLYVVGMWKFGFPETLLYMFHALYNNNKTRTQRIADGINALGTVMHHGSAAMLLAFLLSGTVVPDRFVLDCILVPIAQHWFALLKYVNKWIYTFITLLLEAWFQWVIFSNFETIYKSNHWIAAQCALTFTISHYMYLLAATIDMAFARSSDANNNNTSKSVDDKWTEIFKERADYEETSSTGSSSVHTCSISGEDGVDHRCIDMLEGGILSSTTSKKPTRKISNRFPHLQSISIGMIELGRSQFGRRSSM